MEFIVYGALACALVLLGLVAFGRLGRGNLDHVAIMADAYQALIDHGQKRRIWL